MRQARMESNRSRCLAAREIKDWGNHVCKYIRTNLCTMLWTVVYIMDYVVQGKKINEREAARTFGRGHRRQI
jgi:hypothetical protein